MNYTVGDQVVHRSFGLGEIVQMDEKILAGKSGQYYVIKTQALTIWVPATEAGECNLRSPASARDFQRNIRLLAGPGKPLPRNWYERKNRLSALMSDGTLESLCRLVRDLTSYKSQQKFTENDIIVLDRAKMFLMLEWGVALEISAQQAEQNMNDLLNKH